MSLVWLMLTNGPLPPRMSLGTGRPIVLRDESSIRHSRALLRLPTSSGNDVRLVSLVELIAQKSKTHFQALYQVFCLNLPLSANLRDFDIHERTS
jgi:hypothetical protein